MASEDIVVCAPTENAIKIKKWKVREGFQVTNNQIILLYELVDNVDKEVKRLKATKCGIVKKRLFNDGEVVEKNFPILELGACIHTTVIKDMCADCGADLRQDDNIKVSEASVPMVHSVPELKVTKTLAQKLGQADTVRLLEDRKLVLLVDLDQTLIHTTNDNIPNNIRGVYHFQLYGPNSPWYHTRLRPGTFEFLSKMAPKYELHICTFGARNYAHMIAQFLDEDGKYFSHRILSRDECFNVTSKTDNLSALFPCGDSMVCIIDDREDVWNMASNLIQVKPYHFFQHTGDINAPPGLSKHELDGKGVDFRELLSASEKEDKKKTNSADAKSKTAEEEEETESLNSEIKNTTNKTISESIIDSNTVFNESNEENEDSSTISIETEATKKENEQTSTVNKSTKYIPNSDSADDSNSSGGGGDAKPKEEMVKCINSDSEDNLIEVEDPDDYLLYLETILDKIHDRFYKLYDETKKVPDLKILIPKIRNEVLIGKTLVFSGLVPKQVKLEQSRAYLIAKALGANVKQQLTEDTTHLVAAVAGTFKANAARKRPEVNIVTPDWLWSCAERWEYVEEKLFPLDPLKPSKMRQPPPHCHSPEHVVNYSEINECPQSEVEATGPEPKFSDTINPLLKFSNADLAAMNQEFDQFFESDTSSDDEPDDIENPPIDKKLKKKRKKEEEKEEVQSHKFFKSTNEVSSFSLGTSNSMDNIQSEQNDGSGSDSKGSDDDDDENDEDDEMPSTKFRRGENLPSDLDIGSEGESANSNDNNDEMDDGDWNMMGAALEREFLGLE